MGRADMLVRRARQDKDLTIRSFLIPFQEIKMMIHTDFAKGENDGLRKIQRGDVITKCDVFRYATRSGPYG